MQPTDWFSQAGFGVMVHWTSQSRPASGDEPLPYHTAVERFDVALFAEQLRRAGAGFVLFTISHAQQYFAFPSNALDAVLPGRTCERDLYAELYEALKPHGIRMMFYYPSVGGEADPQWRDASRFNSDPAWFAELQYDLVAEIGERYGEKVGGWWIDNCYDDASVYAGWGAGRGNRYDYRKYAAALRNGNSQRIVAFNVRGANDEARGSNTVSGIADYEAGESNQLVRLPQSRFSGEGEMQWHALVHMDDFWVHDKPGTPTPRFSDAQVLAYIRAVQAQGGVFTYNAAPFQDELISTPTLNQLETLASLRG